MNDKSKEWLDTYYPVSARDMEEASDKECLEHSILKWKGLCCVEDYGLKLEYGDVVEIESGDSILEISGLSCALCVKHHEYDSFYDESNCETCPLFKSLGKSCDAKGSLFYPSLRQPALMVAALEKCLELNIYNQDVA